MPVRGYAARPRGITMFVEEPAANVTPADGAGFPLPGFEAVWFQLLQFTGTTGSVVVTLQESATTDVNASYATIPFSRLEVPVDMKTIITANPFTLAFNTFAVGLRTRTIQIGYGGSAGAGSTTGFVRMTLSGASGTPDFKIAGAVMGTHRRHISNVHP